MNEDTEVYEQAMQDVKELAEEVMERCEMFADAYYYEKEWVFDQFKKELNKIMK